MLEPFDDLRPALGSGGAACRPAVRLPYLRPERYICFRGFRSFQLRTPPRRKALQFSAFCGGQPPDREVFLHDQRLIIASGTVSAADGRRSD